MEILVWGVHVLLAVVLVILVLLQHGKGADMGAAFGSGSAGSLFGPSGSATFLSRATGFVAAMFFVTSMSLTYFSANRNESGSVMSIMEQSEVSVDSADSNVDEESTAENRKTVPENDDNSKANKIPD
ncbi:preprotein translocase subunit SecG [Nitrosomonas sp. sh817]|mgnify:CR=1 FL=1|uniref:preprotein translocase subunit SecG n=1 Tax=unclassified Nitrosomonas TaxID=2609265 RepID=UPI0027DBBAAB|nr:preprotein translocase subunit SecG [Nitrosomonas sp. sh817]WMJ09041.1 preprotein translocase subunit SecG [Nitrosomonas sp. sh817]